MKHEFAVGIIDTAQFMVDKSFQNRMRLVVGDCSELFGKLVVGFLPRMPQGNAVEGVTGELAKHLFAYLHPSSLVPISTSCSED